jgi:hypothetical protein
MSCARLRDFGRGAGVLAFHWRWCRNRGRLMRGDGLDARVANAGCLMATRTNCMCARTFLLGPTMILRSSLTIADGQQCCSSDICVCIVKANWNFLQRGGTSYEARSPLPDWVPHIPKPYWPEVIFIRTRL